MEKSRSESRKPVVIISGCHAGPNPSSGLGIAKSLREGFNNITLIAKDHSEGSSGIHSPEFDEVWLCRPWDEIDLDTHREQICQRLRKGAWFISALDIEILWLSKEECPNLLLPRWQALKYAIKHGNRLPSDVPFRVPETIAWSAASTDVHAFCRYWNWDIWVKGKHYEARPARNWTDVLKAVDELSATWGDDGLFLQRGICGHEVSMAMAAYRGVLLDSVFLEKRIVTEVGKAWGGSIRSVDGSMGRTLEKLVRIMGWTGGAELEFVKDEDGTLWLIDFNPRFPAWIYGATLAGRNLPAALVAAASGAPLNSERVRSSQFIRVTVEIPVRAEFCLPPMTDVGPVRLPLAKHPSGMSLLTRRVSSGEMPANRTQVETLNANVLSDIEECLRPTIETPARIILARSMKARFQHVAAAIRGIAPDGMLSVAYSVKTNPSEEVVDLARDSGFSAEVVSSDELLGVLSRGFTPDQIVYNGPWAADLSRAEVQPIWAAFADSIDEFRANVARRVSGIQGIRVRPPYVDSRFGVTLENPQTFDALVRLLSELGESLELGLSMHVQSSEVGVTKWEKLACSFLEWASALEKQTGVRLAMLNFGGGWTPDDLERELENSIPRLYREARERFSGLKAVVIEPGKGLVQDGASLISRVVEVRRDCEGRSEVIVDASIAEVPLIGAYPHRIAVVSKNTCKLLGRGRDTILGRLCMERDVLAYDIEIPGSLTVGDFIAVLDVGAYDTSMAYSFGRWTSGTWQ